MGARVTAVALAWPRSIDDVRTRGEGSVFPTHVLEGRSSALVLFAAAFGGAQDALFVLDAGLAAVCVDTDRDALNRMRAAYPKDWGFVHMDAWKYARAAVEHGNKFDVVTADCPTNLFEEVDHDVGLWCALARHAVVLGSGTCGMSARLSAGWKWTGCVRRSSFRGGVWWSVLERT